MEQNEVTQLRYQFEGKFQYYNQYILAKNNYDLMVFAGDPLESFEQFSVYWPGCKCMVLITLYNQEYII